MSYPPREVYAGILFSDLKESTKIAPDDEKVNKLETVYSRITNTILNESNHFFCNDWGDAFSICSFKCSDLAEIALRMRNEIISTNWKTLGLLGAPSIRIGLHFQLVQILHEVTNNKEIPIKIKKVIGAGLAKAARIEPIVDPNQVFCSEEFWYHLQREKTIIKANYIGKVELAKDFGEMDLYQLIWESEDLEKSDHNLRLVKTEQSNIFFTNPRSSSGDLSIIVSDIRTYCESLQVDSTDQNEFESLALNLKSEMSLVCNQYQPDHPKRMAIEFHIERIDKLIDNIRQKLSIYLPGTESKKLDKLKMQTLECCDELSIAIDNFELIVR